MERRDERGDERSEKRETNKELERQNTKLIHDKSNQKERLGIKKGREEMQEKEKGRRAYSELD